MVERGQVIVQDEIAADQPVEALWGMVTEAEVKLEGRAATLRQGNWSLRASIVAPQNAVFEIVSTTPPPPQNPNTGTRKLVVRLPEKVTDLRLVVSLTPQGPASGARVYSWRDRPLAEW
jgi:hypothetical protein